MANMFDRLVKNAGLLKEGEAPGERPDYIPITIATHYLPMIVNDDYSGLDDEEEAVLDKFLAKLPPGGHWATESDDEGYFGKDAVTGLMSTVVDAKYMLPRNPTVGEDEPSVPSALPAPNAPLGEDLTKTPLRYDPSTNSHNGKKLVRGDVLVDKTGKRFFSVDRNSGYMLSIDELTAELKPTSKSFSVSVDPTDKHRYYELFLAGTNIHAADSTVIGEDKPKPTPKPKKRPNDDNIAGMYKELTRQMWDNAEKSMKKPAPPAK